MLQIVKLTKSFDGRCAVNSVDLTVGDDEYLTILGPSGSGKSTLLRLIAGLERPDSGAVLLDGRDVTAAPTHLRGVGIVQQNYALFPHLTVFENVAFGLRHRIADPVGDEVELKRRVDRILALVGLTEFGARMVDQLSGGQKQRVSLARTLVTEPKICLLDEPLGALDANLRERMTIELRRIREVLGVTFLHVTGNEAEALAMGDRMVVLDEGKALMVATPDEVFARPTTARVAKFLNAFNLLPGHVEGKRFVHGGHSLPLPKGVRDAAQLAIRFDGASIAPLEQSPSSDEASIPTQFVASEFLGGRVIYFLRRPDGGIFEVERHLSIADPVDYAVGQALQVTWRADAALVIDAEGRRIEPAAHRESVAIGAD